MHVDVFDQYHFTQSRVHDLDPRVKVLITVLFILSNALLPDGSWPAFALAWLFLLIANDQAGLGLGFTLKRSAVAIPFALVAISAIFSPHGSPLAVWDFGVYHPCSNGSGTDPLFQYHGALLVISASGHLAGCNNPISGFAPCP